MPLLLINKTKVHPGYDPAEAAGDCAGRGRNRKILASASAGLVQRGAQVGSTLLLMPLLLQALGPAQFGIWGAAASLAWLAGFLDVGTGAALVSLVARSMAANDVGEARRQIAGALSFGCAAAGLIGIAGLGAFVLHVPQVRSGPYLIAIIGLTVNIPLNVANNVWMALQKGYFAGCWELAQTLLTLAGLVGATMYTRDLRVYVGVVYMALVISNLGSLVHLFARYPQLRPGRLLITAAVARKVAGEGMMYFLLALVGTLSFSFDNVLTLAFLGPEASARMTIALRVCVMALSVLVALTRPLWPAFAEAAECNDRRWIGTVLLRGPATLLAATVLGSAILLVYGERLLNLWLKTTLGIDQTLLWAVAFWVFAQGLICVPCLLLNGLSILRYQIAVSAAAYVVALMLKFVLSSRLGVPGILWGTTAPTLLIIFPAVTKRVIKWQYTRSQGGTTTWRCV